jgi:hypothetical protein
MDDADLIALRIPLALRGRAREILAITARSCTEHLDDEYAHLCCQLVAWLARKRPSPLLRGDTRIWAAGAIYAVGQVNFLFDPSQRPHLTADQLAACLGVVKSSMANKSALINKTLNLGVFEPDLTRAACSNSTRLPGSSRSTASSSMPRCSHPNYRTKRADAG